MGTLPIRCSKGLIVGGWCSRSAGTSSPRRSGAFYSGEVRRLAVTFDVPGIAARQCGIRSGPTCNDLHVGRGQED